MASPLVNDIVHEILLRRTIFTTIHCEFWTPAEVLSVSTHEHQALRGIMLHALSRLCLNKFDHEMRYTSIDRDTWRAWEEPQYVLDEWDVLNNVHISQRYFDITYWLRKKVIDERLRIEDVRNLYDDWMQQLACGTTPDMPGVFVDATLWFRDRDMPRMRASPVP